MEGRKLPAIVFKARVRDESLGGENPYRWQDVTTDDLFAGKRSVVFALPGAFTPTCTNFQCPSFERAYDEIRQLGIDEVYCIAVNDAFVMFQWAKSLHIRQVKMIPDGSGHFTRRMGMLINKDHRGMGYRSWRYAMVTRHGIVEKWFEEPGINDAGMDDDPYMVTTPENVVAYLRIAQPAAA